MGISLSPGPTGGTEVYADMQQWTEIRRRVLTNEISKREACRQYQIHWLTLKKILAHEEPPGYRRTRPPRRPKIDPVRPVIQAILDADQSAPKKQRHTAHRIWQRLRDEYAFPGGYGQAFPRECTEVFLEGHARAFTFFGGVPRRIAYDNTKTAVAKITGSRERQVTREFLRLQSHYLFAPHFCLVRRPNEKGHVERLLDYARSNFLVPVPAVDSLEELNARLAEQCRRDLDRPVRGKPGTVGTLLAEDRAAFLPLPPRPVEARRVTQATADGQSLVRFDTNSYSVPTRYARRRLTIVATVAEVRVIHEDRLVARHPRCWDRAQYRFDPVHYLALLERKPGGLDYARPLEHWGLPDCFGLLRRRLEATDPTGRGTRALIRVLRLLETCTLPQVTDAVAHALAIDVIDPDSIRVILDHRADRPVELFTLDGRPHLRAVRVAPTDVAAYGALLPGVTP